MSAILPAGSNHTRLWGLTPRERLARMAAKQDLDFASGPGGGPLVANLNYVFDPAWLQRVAARPNCLVSQGGVPVLANIEDMDSRLEVTLAMRENRVGQAPGLVIIPFEESGSLHNAELGKRECPFMGRLTPETVRGLERESYIGAYRGVSDMLTRYLWPEAALVLTRLAARWRIAPNQVTALGALFCVAATFLFAHGYYWTGLLAGLVFTLLDTVDGQLARCTLSASWLGKIFDRGIDLVHPPFWWWAWGSGLYAYGRPLDRETLWWVLAAIVGGYVVQRLIEGAFTARFKIPIHLWRPFDSRFRLIAAGRNPHIVILAASLAAGRPDWGLIGVAAWTAASLLVHAVRLVQALAAGAKGRAVTSWLA